MCESEAGRRNDPEPGGAADDENKALLMELQKLVAQAGEPASA